MPNHVHMIAVPKTPEALRQAIGRAHWHYTRMVNFRREWRGCLWQGRFYSFPMDERHLMAAARYIELNPVTAKLVPTAGLYSWSSAKAHLGGRDDSLVRVKPLLDLVPDWHGFLTEGISRQETRLLRQHETTGRPLGDENFLKRAGELLGRSFAKKKPGPKPNVGYN